VTLLLILGVLIGSGEPSSSGYMEPDKVLIDIVDVTWAPWPSISPDGSTWLLRTFQRNPSIAELAREELKLAGMRFSPLTLAPTRSGRIESLSLMYYPSLEEAEIRGMPEYGSVLGTAWSPDGSMIAFTLETDTGVELWLIHAADASAERLTGPIVSLAANEWPQWLPGSDGILCCTRPEGMGPPPVEDPVPTGPVTMESTGEAAPARTYQDLLENPFQEDLFQYCLTSQLSLVRLDGTVRTIGEPGIIWYFSPSPDGEYLIVSRLMRPFSYAVTAGRFAEEIQVWDMRGLPVFSVASHPVRDAIPIAYGSTFEGPRSVSWRSDTPSTLFWVEALDGGDAAAEAELRDRIFFLDAPFDSSPRVLMELSYRFGGIQWGCDTLAVVYEWWWPTRNERRWLINPSDPDAEPRLAFDLNWENRYDYPGDFMTEENIQGAEVLLISPDGGSLYLEGEGATPEGEMPFLDRLDLVSLETERLFHSSPPCYERPVQFLDDRCSMLLFMRESATEYPNSFILDLSNGLVRQVTHNLNPFHMLSGMTKELITYTRDDGVELSATLYLPPGYSTDEGPLPMVMWAYPQEYISSDAAGQVSGSPYSFDYLGWWSPVIWLTLGYAVLDDPAMPIVARGEELANDTFVEQLVMSAQAAVDEVVRRGVADPERIAIGGHSYGAFMTANLLAHSDLFAVGLARTGAYNRTLTPFGFQSEDRTLWEALDVYIEMSPFMNADQINEPILLIHGDADNNSGTFPMQSERFFAALKGLGGTARLVMLPLESHSYRARESILHVLWETQEWLDRYMGGGE